MQGVRISGFSGPRRSQGQLWGAVCWRAFGVSFDISGWDVSLILVQIQVFSLRDLGVKEINV